MNHLLPLSTLLLAGTVSAQTAVTADLSTKTAIGVYAVQGNEVGFNAIAPGKQIPTSGASVSTGANNFNTHAATLLGWNQWPGGIVTVDMSEQGGVSKGPSEPAPSVGTSPSPSIASFQPGPHSVLLKLTGRPGTRGLLEMWATGGLNVPQGAVAGEFRVDIGDDGTVEYTGSVPGATSQSFVVTIPKTGVLAIELESVVKGTQITTGATLYKFGASLRFTPTPLCVGTVYGDRDCPGPVLSGAGRASGTDWVYELKYTGGTPSGAGLLVIGHRPIHFAIPGIQCPLLTDPLVSLPFRQDATGAAQWSIRFPLSIEVDLRVQAADLRRATASNGLHAVCLR